MDPSEQFADMVENEMCRPPYIRSPGIKKIAIGNVIRRHISDVHNISEDDIKVDILDYDNIKYNIKVYVK